MIAFVFCAVTIWQKTMLLLYIMLMITFFCCVNDFKVKWCNLFDMNRSSCWEMSFFLFFQFGFCSWWGFYKRFYGIVVSWKYVLVNIIYDKYIFVGFFFLCICMVCCNGVIVYWQYVYVCVMNGWNGCFYLLYCMYIISYQVHQTRW